MTMKRTRMALLMMSGLSRDSNLHAKILPRPPRPRSLSPLNLGPKSPQKPTLGRLPPFRPLAPLSVLSSAISRLRANGYVCGGYKRLRAFLSASFGSDLEVVGVAIDCFESAVSRFKIYMRSSRTSFESVLERVRMGGTLETVAGTARQNLKELSSYVNGEVYCEGRGDRVL